MSKGSVRRPPCISRELEELRWKYATQPMSFESYRQKLKELKRKGLVRR